MEFSASEVISGNKKKKEELRQICPRIPAPITATPRLTGRQHVVKHGYELGNKRKAFQWDQRITTPSTSAAE
jgi:hypothetical protein